jgi:hypothetical protein
LGEEYREKTWDFQRMSSISPWSLAMGKLFGSASYIWYFGIPLLLLCSYYFANWDITQEQVREANQYLVKDKGFDSLGYEKFLSEFPKTPSGQDVLVLTALLLLSGIAGHAATFLSALIHLRQGIGKSTQTSILGIIFSAYCMKSAFDMVTRWTELRFRPNKDYRLDHETITWFGEVFHSNQFQIYSILFFCVLFFTGIRMIMRRELQFQNSPLAWLGFVILITTYNVGFIPKEADAKTFILPFSYIFITFLTFIMAYAEANDLGLYKRFLSLLKSRRIKDALIAMPRWLSSAGLVVILYPVTILWWYAHPPKPESTLMLVSFITSITLLWIRDALVMHVIQLGPKQRHAMFLTAVYFGLIYLILPLFVATINANGDWIRYLGNMVETNQPEKKLPLLWNVFYPIATTSVIWSILPILGEVGIATYFLYRKLLWIKSRAN